MSTFKVVNTDTVPAELLKAGLESKEAAGGWCVQHGFANVKAGARWFPENIKIIEVPSNVCFGHRTYSDDDGFGIVCEIEQLEDVTTIFAHIISQNGTRLRVQTDEMEWHDESNSWRYKNTGKLVMFCFRVREELTRERIYKMKARSIEEANFLMDGFLIHPEEETPTNEKLEVRDYDVLDYTIETLEGEDIDEADIDEADIDEAYIDEADIDEADPYDYGGLDEDDPDED